MRTWHLHYLHSMYEVRDLIRYFNIRIDMKIKNTDWKIWLTPDGLHTWVKHESIYENRIEGIYDDDLVLKPEEMWEPEEHGHIFVDYL